MWLDDRKYAPGRKRSRAQEAKEYLEAHEPVADDQAYLAGMLPVRDTPTMQHKIWGTGLPTAPWSPGTPAGFFTPPIPAGMDAVPFTNLGPIESRPLQPNENLPMPKRTQQDEQDVTDFANAGEANLKRKKVKRGITIAPAADEALAPDIPNLTEPAREAPAPAAAEEYVSPSAPLEKTPPATAKSQRVKKKRKDDKDRGPSRRQHPVP
jgi:hypothetical protein